MVILKTLIIIKTLNEYGMVISVVGKVNRYERKHTE